MLAEHDVRTIDAKPAPVAIDLAHAAVLVVDMQNDFGAKGGMFDRAGIDLSPIVQAIPPTARVVEAARSAKMPIVYLKMAHRADLSDTGGENSPHWFRHKRLSVGEEVTAPDGTPSRILIDGTWNTEIIPELAPQAGDVVVRKHRYSGFYETELDAVLRGFKAKYLIVTGCTTSVCVEATIRDAMYRDYACLLLSDCTGQPAFPGSTHSNHEASLLLMARSYAWVTGSEDFLKALKR
jgi:ureidoacrylate peracid hydrolase